MNEIWLVLNNREIAIGIWSILFLILFLFFSKSIRKFFVEAFKLITKKSLLIVLFLFSAYISLEVIILKSIGFWEISFIKDLIFWVVFIALGYLFNFEKFKNVSYFKQTIKENLKIILIIEYICNSFVFSLSTEMLIFPIMCFLGLMLGILESNLDEINKFNVGTNFKIKKGLYLLLNLYIITIVIYSLVTMLLNLNDVFTYSNLKLFALPIILTIMFLSFIYLLLIKETYHELFLRIDLFIEDKWQARQIKAYIVKEVKLSLNKLITLNKRINYVKLIELSDRKNIFQN
ncbi:MAG: hypothetical protein IPL31_04765 [Saprospiraceae bacterium]|nr:hypothetical protein [Saprospiraceae bacterium]